MEYLYLTSLGFLDALNPSTIFAMAFLLATSRAIARGLTFIGGTLCTYLFCGILLLGGWDIALSGYTSVIPTWIIPSLSILAGVGSLGAAAYIRQQSKKGAGASKFVPGKISLTAVFVFAISSTIADLPTAVPYFAAVSLIAAITDSLIKQAALLLFYNLLYISPLVLMLVLCVRYGSQAEPYLQKIRKVIDWCFAKILPAAIAAFGVFLLLYGIWLIIQQHITI